MKHTHTLLLTGFLLAVFSLQTTAQEVHFTYDNSGNRITRTIVWEEDKIDSLQAKIDTAFLKNDQITEEKTVKHTAVICGQTVDIFPNPNTGMFKISIDGWKKNTQAELKLHNLTGKIIEQKPIQQPLTKIKFGNQPDGTYILTIIVNGKKETWKVVKK